MRSERRFLFGQTLWICRAAKKAITMARTPTAIMKGMAVARTSLK